MRLDSPPVVKRRRFTTIDPMDSESAKEMQAKLASAKEKFGREIRVFETTTASSTPSDRSTLDNSEEPDDFYEFTSEDYFRVMAAKKEDKFLKTRKIREAEGAARRSRVTKAVIRVRFADNYTFEAIFHPSETVQSLLDLLIRVINHPEVPFLIYTTPPKKQINDTSLDFYSAGFVPGAIVYFAYDLPKGNESAAASGPFLKEEVMSLQGLEFVDEQAQPTQTPAEPVISNINDAAVPERKPADKKNIKPKWLKM